MAFHLPELRDVQRSWTRFTEAASAEHAPSEEDARINDAVLALISLGYKQVDAHKAVKRALADAGTAGVTLSLEDLVRQALKLMI